MSINRIDIMALIVVILMVFGWNKWDEAQKENAPARDWFVVENIFIPSFIEGENPVMTYSFTVLRETRGLWRIEIFETKQSQETSAAVCVGSGIGNYKPGKGPKSGVTLEWFMGKDCKLPAGEYVAVATWTLQPKGYPEKIVTYVSNPFVVSNINKP